MTFKHVAAAARIAAALSLAAPAAGSAQDRWQITLRDSKILYELQPLRLEGDTLVFQQEAGTLHLPLKEITELRMVRGTPVLATGAIRATPAVLTGADDAVFEMTLLSVEERRAVVEQILQALGSGATARSSPPG